MGTTTTQTVILGGHAYPVVVVQEAITRVQAQRGKVRPASCSQCGGQTWERFYFDEVVPVEILCRACVTENGRYIIRPPWSRLG
jgi:hypothetical protein